VKLSECDKNTKRLRMSDDDKVQLTWEGVLSTLHYRCIVSKAFECEQEIIDHGLTVSIINNITSI
jgi:hypothetical protein